MKNAPNTLSKTLKISSVEEIDLQIELLRVAAKNAHDWIMQQSSEPIEFLRNVKFEKRGFHPISHKAINLIEQVNQTWTYFVALNATRLLLGWHPDAGGFTLAPGATASQELDIMSNEPGLVGAETFAATSPLSNDKVKSDVKKMMLRNEIHRYVFFASPLHPMTGRVSKYEVHGISVWSVQV
jgi:hypothetical protein